MVLRVSLLALSFIGVFIAAVSWLYLALSFLLWLIVFGDDSTTFGYYALALAIPLASAIAVTFTWTAVRWVLSPKVLAGVIVTSLILEVFFVISIES